ncbi:PilW family protein [uncultured Zhongshania sp.]|uniref:PilW family protein n=1 Tax=uncultured Zhongshania sp. TaxID=1642288 RepID=UPI0025CE2253|nr:PilW family protein [uncultured Zhongshania sp.]
MIRRAYHVEASQRGLSLIELLIAMGLGAFMLLGIISLVASVSTTRTELANTSDQIENGRYALQVFNEDVALGGFFGKYHPGIGAVTYTSPSPCETTAANLGFDSTLTPVQMPLAVNAFPYDSASSAPGLTIPSCFSAEVRDKSEILIVRHVDPNSVAVTAANIPTGNTTPYLQISGCDLDSLSFRISTDRADLTLRENGCTGALSTLAEAWPYTVNAYFISPCNDCSGAGDGIASLKSYEFRAGSGGIRTLVEGVEDIHFDYGLDLDGDGGPDCYVVNPTVDTKPAACPVGVIYEWEATDNLNWQNVVSIQIKMLVRGSRSSSNVSNTKTYNIGREILGPYSDNVKRQVYSTVVMLPNVAGVRE